MSESNGGTQHSGPDEEEQLRAAAASRLKRKSDFHWHLVAYVVINGFFWALWALTSGVDSYPWPAWITLCWGLGVAFHWWDATRRPITPQAIQREMDRMRGEK